MISLSKLLLLLLVIAAVWYGYRIAQRRGAVAAKEKPPVRDKARSTPAKTQGSAEEMRKCDVCGVYVPADATRCGTPGCPQG